MQLIFLKPKKIGTQIWTFVREFKYLTRFSLVSFLTWIFLRDIPRGKAVTWRALLCLKRLNTKAWLFYAELLQTALTKLLQAMCWRGMVLLRPGEARAPQACSAVQVRALGVGSSWCCPSREQVTGATWFWQTPFFPIMIVFWCLL